jgi:hypothetical protein
MTRTDISRSSAATPASDTGYIYIYHGNGANVIELDDAAPPRTGWCFVPGDHLVAGNVMLAQKIALETDERGALASANNFTPR